MKVELLLKNKNANVMRVPVEKTIVLGRGEECDLRIASNNVSRRHCRLELKDDYVTIRDMGSSNGTFINGKQLPEKKAVKIVDGMIIKIGPLVAKIKIHDDEIAEEAVVATDPVSSEETAAVQEEAIPVEPDSAEMETTEFDGVIPTEGDAAEIDDDQPHEETVGEDHVAEDEFEQAVDDTAFFDEATLATAEDEVVEEHEVEEESDYVDDADADADADDEYADDVEEYADEDDEYTEEDEAVEYLEDEPVEDDSTEGEATNAMDELFPEDDPEEDVFGDETGEAEEFTEYDEDSAEIATTDDESLSDFLKGLE